MEKCINTRWERPWTKNQEEQAERADGSSSNTSIEYGRQSARLKEIGALDPECQGALSETATAAAGTPPRPARSAAAACDAWETPCLPRQHPERGGLKAVSVKRECCQRYVVFACDEVSVVAELLPTTGAETGIRNADVRPMADQAVDLTNSRNVIPEHELLARYR